MPPQIHAQIWDVQNRLAGFGLSVEILQEAVQAGHLGFTSCTELDSPIARGITAWNSTLRRLREMLIPTGWKWDNAQNFSHTFSTESKINILVATGDKGTGLVDWHPRTKSPKGRLTELAISHNIQLAFEGFISKEESERRSLSVYGTTWIFLTYITATKVRAELSLPSSIEDGHISAWKERIILPQIEVAPESLKINSPDNDPGPEFDVPVRLKS